MLGSRGRHRFRRGAGRPTVRGMAPVPSPPAQPDDTPESYVGLDAEAAERQAGARGWSTVRALPPGAVITMEFRGGRLNFEVDAGTVTRCWVG
jgi:hypothetical protein